MNNTSSLSVNESSSATYLDEEARWRAVLRKDRRADGKFFFAVKTTGVFCRPSCPARRAHRENVTFYESAADAEQAGFRACMRCDPKGPTPDERHAAAVIAACRAIETAEETPTLSDLANSAGMSRFHFHRIFKRATGLSPKGYATANRSERMRDELARRPTITEAIYEAGFNSNGRFYAESSGMLGMKPRDYRSGGEGETIRFAVGECSLGSILVAASAKGVCAISLGDDPDALSEALQDRFPRANIVGGDKGFERLVAKVVGLIEAPRSGLALPLDVRGTAFQQRVWKALREIPSGTTSSYSEIAKRVGSPKAVRAVARACASNPLAVAIPCHRVVRRNGNVSGYRWGIERKIALLKKEKVATRKWSETIA
jgi:AraC family transcriptional regulator, regulatory protein of adaptative response / methylated-DNA-[protein]-cysteine methyltransferase